MVLKNYWGGFKKCQLHSQCSILNITKLLISVHEAQGFLILAKLVNWPTAKVSFGHSSESNGPKTSTEPDVNKSEFLVQAL